MTNSQRKGQKILFLATSALLLSVVGIFSFNDNIDAFAKKSQKVIDWSNGFPEGEHSTMNIHGKKEGYNCDNSLQGIEPYGSSVFVPIDKVSEINIVSNKRSSVTHGYAIDPCAHPFGQEDEGETDPALYQLPTGEHQVYWRILGKPNNGNGQNGNDGSSEVMIYPKLVDLCNFLPEAFSDGTTVNSFDPDAVAQLQLKSFIDNEKFVDLPTDGTGNGILDVGESIYRDDLLDGGIGVVSINDALIANDNSHPTDGTTSLSAFTSAKYYDANGNDSLDDGETVYRDNGDGIVSEGDIRLVFASSQGLPSDQGGDAIDCQDDTLVGLGLITKDGAYDKTKAGLERFDDSEESTQKGGGKGKSTAMNITDLFKWSGAVCDVSVDTNGDGELTQEGDYPLLTEEVILAAILASESPETADLLWPTAPHSDSFDLVISEEEFTAYLSTLAECTVYPSTWIFDIADIVIHGLDYDNNGSTLTQVRFYPIATTDFT
jgi:hypothetical protein